MRVAGLSLLAAAAIARATVAQSVAVAQVPAAVRQSFVAKFPASPAPTWTIAPDQTYVAEFTRMSADVRATFKPSGEWRESATQIGAITLPDAVRSAVTSSYRGYRFVETRRVERAASPPLFEVRLERSGDSLTVRLESSGKVFSTRSIVAPLVVSVAGTWRGTSTCPVGRVDCHGESLVYHITAVATDTSGFDAETNRVVDGREELIARLPCTLDRRRSALYCSLTNGAWEFQVRHDSLIGGFTYKDGTSASRVAVRRVP
jgi:hypothetical protein